MKEVRIKNRSNYDNAAIKLTITCMLVYCISYFGRKSYNSNLNEIMGFYSVDKDMAGLVGTFFFISYAIGQVFHGLMCKRYAPRIVITSAMAIGAVCNFLMAVIPADKFVFLKFIWLVNGFAMASLWSVMIRLLNRVMTQKHVKESLVAMAFPVSIGTFLTYGVSALCSYLGMFRFTFWSAGACMLVAAVVWFVFSDTWTRKCEIELEESGEIKPVINADSGKPEKVKISPAFYIVFGVLAIMAIADNFVKDGLTDWTPTVLVEKYKLENWLSLLLTIALPCIACLGSLFALVLHKKVKDYIALCGILFAMALAGTVILVACFGTGIWIITLVCFMFLSFIMSAVNNVITNIYPMQVERGINAGMVAGLIDGFCYVGSAASSYGLGAIAKNASWNTVMYVILITVAVCVVISGICLVVNAINKRKNKEDLKI